MTPVQASQKYVLALDLGSTGLKAAIVSAQGDVITQAYEPNETIILPDGGAEQDAKRWWTISLQVSKKVIADSGVAPEHIVGICCDSQYFVTVPVNEHAEPLMNAVSWMDTRGGKYNRQLMHGFPSVQGMSIKKLLKFIRLTGVAPTNSGADALAHMLAVKNELPEIYKNTYKFLEPADYLTSRLTGKISASQHTATSMMLTSNRRWGEREYCQPLLRLSGLDPDKLPELLPSDGIVGNIERKVAAELGLSPTTQVVCGMYDNQAAIAGAGIVDLRQGLLLVSTTLSINGYVNAKKTDILSSIASIPSCLPDKYMLLCEQGLGGKCLEYYLQNIACHDDDLNFGGIPTNAYQRLNDMAGSVPPGSGNVLFLPWLNGSLAPAENKNARGGFFNLSLDSNRYHLTRAVMEGVAFNSRAALGPVEKFMGCKFKNLRFAGGGALSDIWAQIYADVLQIPILQMEDPVQVTCRGAGLIGLVRLGHLALAEIPHRVKIRQTFEPNAANRTLYETLFTQYRALFKNNQKVFNTLNG
ncbi:MAG: xylulose kinase [SAR324 cluster bacterium]|nr:xylulose kinase [SAR324 cluster bacterium]